MMLLNLSVYDECRCFLWWHLVETPHLPVTYV